MEQYISKSALVAEMKNPETPFGPKPFDKVLVRDSCGEEWRAEFFSHIDNERWPPYICVGSQWEYCIPYNDETKHLLGTNQEPPEKYRILNGSNRQNVC